MSADLHVRKLVISYLEAGSPHALFFIVSSGFFSLHVLSLSELRLDTHCLIFTELVAHVRNIIILLQGDINDL